jgi:hypothetical protein
MQLTLSTEGEWLRFSHATSAVEYKRDNVLKLMIHLKDRLGGWEHCSVRVRFRGDDGMLGSLALVTADTAHAAWFKQLSEKLHSLRLPIPVEVMTESVVLAYE